MGTFHNVETGEVEVRELTPEEKQFFEAQLAEEVTRAEKEAAKAIEKAALLSRLGITEEQAKLLLG
jgi:competence protein ComGF